MQSDRVGLLSVTTSITYLSFQLQSKCHLPDYTHFNAKIHFIKVFTYFGHFKKGFSDIFLSKAQTGAASLVSSWCWILKNAKAQIEFILIVNKMVYLRFEMLQSVLADFKKSHAENFIGGANKLTIIRAEALGELCESGSGKVRLFLELHRGISFEHR